MNVRINLQHNVLKAGTATARHSTNGNSTQTAAHHTKAQVRAKHNYTSASFRTQLQIVESDSWILWHLVLLPMKLLKKAAVRGLDLLTEFRCAFVRTSSEQAPSRLTTSVTAARRCCSICYCCCCCRPHTWTRASSELRESEVPLPDRDANSLMESRGDMEYGPDCTRALHQQVCSVSAATRWQNALHVGTQHLWLETGLCPVNL